MSSSSKRRRYDDEDDPRGDLGDSRRDRELDSSSRDKERERERDGEHRQRERGSERDRDRDYRSGDRDRDRDRRSERDRDGDRSHHFSRRRDSPPRGDDSRRSSRRDSSRDRGGRDRSHREESPRDRRTREKSYERDGDRRDGGGQHRSDDRDSPSRSPEKRRSPPIAEAPLPPAPIKKPAFASTFSAGLAAITPAKGNGSTAPTPASPSVADSATKTSKDDEEKLRIKREKLEAWKAKKAATAAASPAPSAPSTPLPTPAKVASPSRALPAGLPAKPVAAISKPELPAKPKAAKPSSSKAALGSNSASDPASRALAAATAIASRLVTASPLTKINPGKNSLPAKPTFSFASTQASFRPSGLQNSLTLDQEEDDEKKDIGFMNFDTADDVDMDVNLDDMDDDDDEEDLEGGVVFKARAGGRAGNMDTEETVENGMDVDETETKAAPEEEEEEDELEMFMSGVQAQVKTVDQEDQAKLGTTGKSKNTRLVEPEAKDEDEGPAEPDSDEDLEKVGDSAAELLAIAAKKVVRRGRELTTIDHSKINYEPFRKAFYHAPPEIELLTPEEVEEMRVEMDGIKVRGADPPKPAAKWSYCGLPSSCIDVIKKLEYAAPTSIQAQAIPAIMSGRDIIGVAKTGSGKTIAFLLPMLRHVKDQRALRSMEGPIAMIMTPTRELATQIFKECKPFLKALGLRASCAYGGTPLKDNIADMKRGSELVVCTPGRMIELLTTNSGRIINLQRVTYLVLDEADRMFDMGFEPQVMKIINQIRPDRQTVLFSATFPRQMEALARKILSRPLEITVGGRSIVAPEIEQIVEVREEDTKFNRLLELLGRLMNDDSDARALIFVERQDSADTLLQNLLKKNYSCMSLHGGMEQVDRDQTIVDFKSGVIPVVIATSVAARGLDVKQLKLVIQYDAPNHMEDYVHRAGRTGRAGAKGTCVTFVTPEQDRYALDIFKALVASSATIPDDLRQLAESFADKIKAGKESASSGFGGKGLERLDLDRDAQSRAERAAYGEVPVEKKAEESAAGGAGAAAEPNVAEEVADMEVEIKRGPAPEAVKKGLPATKVAALDDTTSATAEAAIVALEAANIASGMAEGMAKSKSMLARYNLMLSKARTSRATENDTSTDSARRRDPDATDFHAIIFINDYPQKARWKVTNKDTMVQLVESTGASITNKGVFYEPGKEPGPDELPKLHLLIESNDEFRVKHAISEIKRSLIEGATMALQAEAEQRGTGGSAPGRYNVV